MIVQYIQTNKYLTTDITLPYIFDWWMYNTRRRRLSFCDGRHRSLLLSPVK